MKIIKLSIAVLMAAGTGMGLSAAEKPKVTLSANRILAFNQLPPKVDSLSEMLTEGMFYGRLRINTFRFDWKKEDYQTGGKKKDNWAAGFGGSLFYKSAEYNGFSGMAGLYTSQSPWHMNDSDAGYLKAGKDVTSRYNVKTTGDWGMTVLAQACLQYRFSQTNLRAGRQIFESFLTKSNDTKMIPNTFEGYTLHSKDLKGTTLKAAYLTKQKLRDHTTFHHLLAYGDDPSDPYAQYTENDDAGMHRGLTVSKLADAGIEDRLIVLQADNTSVKNLKVMLNYTAVPDLISSATIEAHYTIPVGSFKIVPGVRYMNQFDDGAGAIGGANLRNETTGYSDPDSLDSWLFAARVDINSNQAWKLRFGYSQVADKGDIVAPWRGFPTGGFTRAMSQYNWYANTKTYMIRGDYDFGKAGLVPGLTAMFRYAIQDFDDTKPGVQADSNVIHLDAIQKFKSFPGLEARVRIGLVNGNDSTYDMNGALKTDPSYNEYRFELNYLF